MNPLTYTEKDIDSICTRYGVNCSSNTIDLDSIKGKNHQEQTKNISNLSGDLSDAGIKHKVNSSTITILQSC